MFCFCKNNEHWFICQAIEAIFRIYLTKTLQWKMEKNGANEYICVVNHETFQILFLCLISKKVSGQC